MSRSITPVSISILFLLLSIASSHAASSFKEQYRFIIASITEMPAQKPFYQYVDSSDQLTLDRRNPKAILDELEIFSDPEKTFDSHYKIELGINGSGFLEIGGTETVLCNLKDYAIQSCVYGLAGWKTSFHCIETYWHAIGRDLKSYPILMCTRSISAGVGLNYSSFLFFENERNLQYLGSIPKHAYESYGGETLVHVEILEPGTDENSRGIVSACPSLSYRRDLSDEYSEAKVACSTYAFDGGGNRLTLVEGPEIRNRSLVDVYQKQFQRLGRDE